MNIVENVEKEVTTTVQTYVDLLDALHRVQDLPGLKFAKKISDNIKKLELRLAPLHMALKPTKEFEEFAAKVMAEAGNDEAKRKALEFENPEIVQAREKQIEEAREMLKEPLEVQLRKIHEDELPQMINARQLRSIDIILA
jgi:hypothetical protein